MSETRENTNQGDEAAELVVGIDLGTTNSEVAAYLDGEVVVLGPAEQLMLPSCVGISPEGELLVGEAARNQALLHPERTVRSIKRKMGTDARVRLGEQELGPAEVSSLILRELAARARRQLGREVTRAVITVPAYFSDLQRNATREAGALAGLEVVRILNEPTAASLAYGYGDGEARTVMIYDLGGGTFDVSIVSTQAEVTEVLASHGNNRLGGDDFDELVLARLSEEFRRRHDIELGEGHPAARARLRRAAEEAKKRLSDQPSTRIREDALVTVDGEPLHLDLELTREELEGMIRPLVESTLESVSRTLRDADIRAEDLDAVLLVGGSTRIPLVSEVLEERTGLVPRKDVHPDLCVALGAAVLASRLAGHEVARILVDVSPYSFGPAYLGERDGVPYPNCYHPVLHRNTPLPVTRTERYYTATPYQTVVDVRIYQGEDPDALKNLLVGQFQVEGLEATEEQSEVLCEMKLDLDGILQVAAIEKRTGRAKRVTIADALGHRQGAELEAVREQMESLYASRVEEVADDFASARGAAGETAGHRLPVSLSVVDSPPAVEAGAGAEGADVRPGVTGEAPERARARDLLERSRALLGTMHAEDAEEAVDLNEQLAEALAGDDPAALATVSSELEELLFFVEGK